MAARSDHVLSGLPRAALALQPRTIGLRRRLHRHPEQGLRLPVSQASVLAELADLPLRVLTGHALTSVVAVLDGERPGPTVLLRGDMDALPLTEQTGLPYASAVEGSMHACGHDTHTAMLASAARLLCERRSALAGRVLLMFQPGEEGEHGARHMIDEGLLEVAGVPDRAYALHMSATMPAGTVQTRPGPIMAAADVLRVTVHGRGGHASAPHDTLDPVPAAAAMIGALQTMVTRRVSALEPAVLTIAHLRAGSTSNVIPETAYLEGTLRTLSDATRTLLREQVDLVGPMESPILGAEDFSYVLDRVPGALAFLGGCPPGTEPRAAAPNHSSRVVFDEAAMADGVAMYAGLALDALA
jgi:amidohydrolase